MKSDPNPRGIRFGAISVLTVMIALLSSSCASGRHYAQQKKRSVRDRVAAKQSSYRVRGTDRTGVLTGVQRQRLQAKTRVWRWPTNEVRVTSHFGSRNGDYHDGIDLKASSGTKVYAAADGKVIYSGSKISGYGRMIVLRHEGKLSTIYAHNSKLYVKSGQRIRRGQLIALSGNTGRSSGPHVHFEIQEGVTAINPILLLPSPTVVNEANRRMMASNDGSSRHTQSSPRRATNRRVASSPPAARVTSDDGFKPRSPRSQVAGDGRRRIQ